jgi:ribosomal protein S18 acetylase RimI-like enzyme
MSNREITTLNRFRREFQGIFYVPITEGDADRIKKQDRVYFRYLLGDKNEIMGLVIVSAVESLTRRVAVIEDLVVDKRFRKKGYGKQMLESIIKWAQNNKFDCIEVCTKVDNEVAIGLYKKYGFEDRHNISLRKWLK